MKLICWLAGTFVYQQSGMDYTCPSCTYYNGVSCVGLKNYQAYRGTCDLEVRQL
jgi:hypothetical protein